MLLPIQDGLHPEKRRVYAFEKLGKTQKADRNPKKRRSGTYTTLHRALS